MKNNRLRDILAGLLLLSLMSIIVVEFWGQRTQNTPFSVTSFREKFTAKQQMAQKALISLADTLIKGQTHGLEKVNPKIKRLGREGIVLLVYEGDSIISWTDNSVAVPQVYDSLVFSSRFHKFGHAWYVVREKQVGQARLLALIHIKNDYPYQNRYLRNEFHPQWGLPPSVKVIKDVCQGVPVMDDKENYLFSLVAGDVDFSLSGNLTVASLLYLCALVVFLLFSLVSLKSITDLKLRRWGVVIFGFLLWGVREIMLGWGVPESIYSLELFSPVLYASTYYFSSLGDFLLNALFVLLWVYAFSRCFDLSSLAEDGSRVRFYAIFFVVLLWVFFFFGLLIFWFRSLVTDSSISFQMYEFSNITLYTFLGYWGIVLLFYILMLGCDVLVDLCKNICPFWHYSLLILGVGIVLGIVEHEIMPSLGWSDLAFLFLLLLAHGLIIYRGDPGFRYSLFILMLIGVSVFIVYGINNFTQQKERQGLIVSAMNLSTEYDPTSEALLLDMNDSLVNDAKIKRWCHHPFQNEDSITQYVRDKYFNGYWEQFQIQVTLCHGDDNLRVEPNGEIRNCFQFFKSMVDESGEQIPGTCFYYLNAFDGLVSYLGTLSYSYRGNSKVNIYLRIDSKRSDEGLGYPDLLLDEKFNSEPRNNRYSYAKYKQGRLMVSSGRFNYYMSSDFFKGDKEFTWVRKDHYDHLIYSFGHDNAVVVSVPVLSIYNRLITFPYIFVSFYLFALLVWMIERFPWKFSSRFTFKYRIQYSLVGILMVFFVVLGGGSVFYNIKQFEDKHNQQLRNKLQLVKRELLGDGTLTSLQRDNYSVDRLRWFSNLINADINIYDPRGRLMATSRPEIYEKKLVGVNMDYEAYVQLFYQGRTQYIHKESMGELEYLSAYEAIVDDNNKAIAYLNLPYFMRNQELQQELFNLVIAGINLHLFMILLAIFLSVIISNKITYPLKLIQDRFKRTRLGSGNQQIDYPQRDEIGSLVEEYNRMVVALGESAQRLAQSERESAWREMARQIAHEIKNPLTPMKLSIQYLQKSWDDKVPDWDKYLQRVSQTLIEQIDNLSSIATAFSNFAKMPEANNEHLNLVHILKHVLQLYRSQRVTLRLELNGIQEAFVFVDKEQFVRVFVNLINNAIQAIPENQKGNVTIELKRDEGSFVIEVRDNGMGISEEVKDKLFVPNFTTKSSGMGLGLAIVKNIVDNASGEIWVESKLDEGSSFFIRLAEHQSND